MDQQTILYLVVCVVIVFLIVGGILVRTKKFGGGKKRIYRPAVLLKTEREYGEVTDSQGVVHKGVVAMTLTFGFKDGTTKCFPVDHKMRGHCSENDWGHIMYEGDKLLKFECKSGEIGGKLYVQTPKGIKTPKK